MISVYLLLRRRRRCGGADFFSPVSDAGAVWPAARAASAASTFLRMRADASSLSAYARDGVCASTRGSFFSKRAYGSFRRPLPLRFARGADAFAVCSACCSAAFSRRDGRLEAAARA